MEGLFWGPGGTRLYFLRAGDLWSVAGDGRAPPSPVWQTPEAETDVAVSPDGAKVTFVRGETLTSRRQRTEGDVYVRSLAYGKEKRMSQGGGVARAPPSLRRPTHRLHHSTRGGAYEHPRLLGDEGPL